MSKESNKSFVDLAEARAKLRLEIDRLRSELVEIEKEITRLVVSEIAPIGRSARRAAVLRLIFEGKHNKEIAATLGISVRTVKFHVTNILQLNSVSDRKELMAKRSAIETFGSEKP